MNININKVKLLDKLKENRAIHEAEYKEAKEGYITKLRSTFTESLKELDRGEDIDFPQRLNKPVNYLKEYDCAILMLENTEDPLINLTSESFKTYWLDEWEWTKTYLYSNSMYSKTVSSKMGSF